MKILMHILSFFTLREGEKVEMWERKLLLEFLRDEEEEKQDKFKQHWKLE